MVLLVAACALIAGCEDARVIFGDLSEEMRGEEAEEGRAGTLRALEVNHRAHRVAEDLAARPEPRCALDWPDAGYVYTLELTLERGARDGSAIEWRETRTFIRDQSGQMRLEMDATYRDDLGKTGTHRPVRTIVDGALFEGPDAEHLYRRQVTPTVRERVRLEGLGAMQTLLDAVGGWSQKGSAAQWTKGGGPLVCGPQDTRQQSWLRRLATRGDVVDASLVREEGSRRLEIRWLLEDGVVMKIRAEDRVAPYDGELEPPSKDVLVEVRRERDWRNITGLLERMEAAGAAERPDTQQASDADRGD